MMRTTTDDLGMPVPVIFHELCCEFGAGSAAALTSVHCVCVSELLQQPVNATFRPSNAVTYDVRDDVTSDCQVKYVKSHCHIINSGTILVRKQFYFHAVSNTKIILKIG